jgi:adenine deaminase
MATDRPLDLAQFLERIPKVEIHCHLLGTVRYETFLDLAQRAGAALERAFCTG